MPKTNLKPKARAGSLERMVRRRIVAISVAGVENNPGTQCNFVTVVLCNDGSVFEMRDAVGAGWSEYPPIPQPPNDKVSDPATP